jgi:DNA-binding response OmpR family regulator
MVSIKIEDPEQLKVSGLDLDDLNKSRQCVLIVEDEPDTILLLKQILQNAGFNVRSALSGQEAIEKVTSHHPDLVLLDLMMPEMDGWETFRYIRQVMDMPVIILSALAIKDDIVIALQLGVDDYITKPFYNAEVVARVKSVLRRARTDKRINRIAIPRLNIIVDLDEQYVSLSGKRVELTPREFAIFCILARKAPGVVRYPEITEEVWGEDSTDARKRTKFLVYLIRKKLEEATPGEEIIVNLDRIGYKLNTESID